MACHIQETVRCERNKGEHAEIQGEAGNKGHIRPWKFVKSFAEKFRLHLMKQRQVNKTKQKTKN